MSDYKPQRVKSAFADLGSEMAEHWNRSLGFGLFWTWIWLVFQDSAFGEKTNPIYYSFTAAWLLPVLFYALGFALLGILYKWRKIVFHGNLYYSFILPAMMACGSIFCTLTQAVSVSARVPIYVIGCVLLGLGAAFFHTEWARLFGSIGARQTVYHGVTGTLIATGFVSFLRFTSLLVLTSALILLPFLSVWCMLRDPKETPRLYLYGRNARMYMPWKLMVTGFTQGISLGAMEIVASSLSSGYGFTLSAVSFSIGALAMLMAILFYKADYNFLIYLIGFPIMAIGWFLLSLGGTFLSAGIITGSIGYRFVDLAIWSLTIYLIKQKDLPTNLVCAVNTCSLMIGQLVGIFLASYSIVSSGLLTAILSPTCMILLLLFVALLIRSNNNLKTGWGLLRPSDDDVAPNDIEVACQTMGKDYDLTKREIEILFFLAKGRNKVFIGQQLTLSQDTVKTHIHHIYLKLDVHTQQELMTKVEYYLDDTIGNSRPIEDQDAVL